MSQLKRVSLVLAMVATAQLSMAPALRCQTSTTAAPPRVPLFTWNDAALAGGFIAGTVALRPVDEYFARHLQNKYTQQNRFLQDVATTVRTIAEPGAMIIGVGLYVGGRLSKQRDMADLGLHGSEAVVVGGGVSWVLKNSFGRARPYVKPRRDSVDFDANNWQFGRGLREGDQYRSFPSGHSVAAFAAAAAVANETSRWWPGYKWLIGTAMYGGAGLVGVSRMYNNRHWASDVMMGAAIGTFAGNKVVRYHHRVNPSNKFDKWLLGGSLHQADDGGMAFTWSIFPAPR
jgi:membrane-associated phospholipid phosphatase